MPDRVSKPVCSAVARVMHPGTVKYSFGFESGADSWTGSNVVTTYPHRGVQRMGISSAPGTSSSTRTITGLTVGRPHIFSAWAANSSNTVALSQAVGVSGIGSSTPVLIPFVILGRKWTKLSYTFTPTATSHSFQLISVVTGGVSVPAAWDDISLQELPYQIGSDIVLDLKPGSSITLDERRSPYAEAQLRVALPSQTDLDSLDTRSVNQVRVVVTATQTFISPADPPQTRTFDLLLHERDAEHSAGETVSLVCRSDEALLIDAGNATSSTDASPTIDQKSLRAIIATKLESHFAILEPGTPDADFTITTSVTNRATTPSFETVVTGAVAGAGASALASVTSGPTPPFGSRQLRWTAAAGTSAVDSGTSNYSAEAGKTYTWSFYLASSIARSALARLTFYDASAIVIGSSYDSAIVTTSTSSHDRYYVTATAPANTASMKPQIVTTSNSAGQFHYSDGWMVHEGALLDYFDGSTASDTYYSYAWSSTANASTSSRIRLDSRDAQLLFQDPGEKDWDVVGQLAQAANLRLFCDEERKWRLVDPTTYAPAGTVALEGAKRGSDRISREDGDWCDAVVVVYRWIDDDGLSQVAYDSATAGGTCLLTIEIQRPYPGPGAAAGILARYQGRGRVQEIVTPFDLTATPGMALTTELPNTPAQDGFVSKVTWTLGDFSTSVEARDLEDA